MTQPRLLEVPSKKDWLTSLSGYFDADRKTRPGESAAALAGRRRVIETRHLVLMAVATQMRSEGDRAMTSVDELSRWTGRSAATVRGVLGWARRAGWLEQTARGNRHHAANVYAASTPRRHADGLAVKASATARSDADGLAVEDVLHRQSVLVNVLDGGVLHRQNRRVKSQALSSPFGRGPSRAAASRPARAASSMQGELKRSAATAAAAIAACSRCDSGGWVDQPGPAIRCTHQPGPDPAVVEDAGAGEVTCECDGLGWVGHPPAAAPCPAARHRLVGDPDQPASLEADEPRTSGGQT